MARLSSEVVWPIMYSRLYFVWMIEYQDCVNISRVLPKTLSYYAQRTYCTDGSAKEQ
jgi:hypothetical protein